MTRKAFFTFSRNKVLVVKLSAVIFVIVAFFAAPLWGATSERTWPKTPLEEKALRAELSLVRGKPSADKDYPKTIHYIHEFIDFRNDELAQEERTFILKKKPVRIIPHAVGITEILWAICPGERLIAFNELAADQKFSFLAREVKKQGPIFNAQQVECVIGAKPDLVFTVFYSDPAFKEKLKQANVPLFDLGYFGTIESIKKQILLVGRIIGEEGNAEALVKIIDTRLIDLKTKLPKTVKPLRVLYYDKGGYIPGRFSNFNSLCEMIGVINVGTEQRIKSLKQIDFETLLSWDPDIIIVPQGSSLKEQLLQSPVLATMRAIKKENIHYLPHVYLAGESQFMLLSANLLAGIVYNNAF
jgi:iron complex transport system substrate-binding protein